MVEKLLKKLGYSEKQIDKIMTKGNVKDLTPATFCTHIEQNFAFFRGLHLSDEAIMKATTNQPSLLVNDVLTLSRKIDDLIALGYEKEKIVCMFTLFPALLSMDIANIRDKMDQLVKFGFPRQGVIKIVRKLPSLIGYPFQTIEDKMLDIEDLGHYTGEQVIEMVLAFPQLLSLKMKNIETKYAIFTSAGFTEEEIITVTLKYPNAYGNSDEKLTKKLETVARFGLKDYILKNPKSLFQAPRTTTVRVLYLTDFYNGLPINDNEIFANKKQFHKKYSITEKELFEKYGEEEKRIA